MTFGQAVSTCISKYVKFEGRASRSEYWYFWLFTFLLSFCANFIDLSIGTSVVNIIVSLALLLPSIAVGVRRMHDSDHSGWWIICPVVNLIFCFFGSTPGDNQYGPMPE